MFQGGDPSDLRFQFKVIEGLSESLRQQATSTERLAAAMADMQKTQVSMLERLATLEAGKVTTRLDDQEAKIDALMRDKDQRTGMMNAIGALPKVVAFIVALASVFSAVYLFGRATGVIQSPPTTVTRIEPTAIRELDQPAGGKP